ncbi:Uncharacterised protein [Legionella pneumophila]|nr:Uncharacterised protein [Legionella pneumophila]
MFPHLGLPCLALGFELQLEEGQIQEKHLPAFALEYNHPANKE